MEAAIHTEILEGIIVAPDPSSGGLVSVADPNPVKLFTDPILIDALLEAITTAAKDFSPSTATAKTRQEIASRAYRVSQTKSYLESVGKDVATGLKELPKKVDATRKTLRDSLDILRDEIRQPLTDWEAEQALIEAAKVAAEEAAALAKQIDSDHEFALLMDEKFKREAEDRLRAAEQARLDHEARIREEAEEQAKAEAAESLERAEREKHEAERRVIEAEERAEREKVASEQARLDAEAHTQREKEEAEVREAEAYAAGIEAARLKQEAEDQRKADLQAARERDEGNKRRINNEALSDVLVVMGKFGVLTTMEELATLSPPEAIAKAIVIAIATGRIRNVAIKY